MSLWIALTLAAAPRFLAPAADASTIRPSVRVFVEGPRSTTVLLSGTKLECTPGVPDGGAPPGVAPLLHCAVPLRPGRQTIRAQAGTEWSEVTLTRLDASRSRVRAAPRVSCPASLGCKAAEVQPVSW